MKIQINTKTNRLFSTNHWQTSGFAIVLALLLTFTLYQTVSWAASIHPINEQKQKDTTPQSPNIASPTTHQQAVPMAHSHADHIHQISDLAVSELPTGTARAFFQAQLVPDDTRQATAPPLSSGRVVAAVIDNILYMRVMVSGEISPTVTHLHERVNNAPDPLTAIVYTPDERLFDANNSITATIPITTFQMSKLKSGQYYINIHSQAYPDGELAGVLLPYTPPTYLFAELSGLTEVPTPVHTTGSGYGFFRMVSTDTIDFEIAVSGVISISSAHIHRGAEGKGGRIVFWLQAADEAFDPDHPVEGRTKLNGEQLVDLFSDHLHANLHTVQYPRGEIRGQVTEARVSYLPIVYQRK